MTDPAPPRPGRHRAPQQAPRAAPAPPGVELADLVAAAVLTVPGVIGLPGGMFRETATYRGCSTEPGTSSTEDVTSFHLSVVYGAPVFATAQQVRTR